jgi:cytochrome c-type biogenesis protein
MPLASFFSPRRLLVAAASLTLAAGLLVGARRHATPAPAPAPCESGAATACEVKHGDAPVAAEGAPVEPLRGKPRLLEFESEHCTVCARMAPIVKELEERCAVDPDTIVRVRVDDARGEALAARYGVRALPTFLGVDDRGDEVERSVGELPRPRLERMLAEVRGRACERRL